MPTCRVKSRISRWGSKQTVPKLSILNIVIGKFPLTGVYSRKAVLGNFPPVIGEGFLCKGQNLRSPPILNKEAQGHFAVPTMLTVLNSQAWILVRMSPDFDVTKGEKCLIEEKAGLGERINKRHTFFHNLLKASCPQVVAGQGICVLSLIDASAARSFHEIAPQNFCPCPRTSVSRSRPDMRVNCTQIDLTATQGAKAINLSGDKGPLCRREIPLRSDCGR